MNKLLYKEVQKYRQPWIWMIIIPALAGAIIYFGMGINQQVIHGDPVGDQHISDAGLIIIAVFSILIMIGVTGLFYTLKMVTEIREDGIYFRYPPLINSNRIIKKEEIDSYEVRKYNPIREYGGWGIRVKLGKAGRAYSVRGKDGLQLHLKNGEKTLLGTQRKEAIRSAMQKMMN